MNRDRQESFRIAAEKVRQKKEKEEREENEFYQRITSGTQWLIFKIVVVFCAVLVLITTIEVFVDGPTKKLKETSIEINQNWEYTWHKVLDVEGYMFTPHLEDWSGHVESSLELTYSPILRTGKKLSYDVKDYESRIRSHVEFRKRSFFTWFPAFQLLMLIPIFTFIFKRQSTWFSFARILSLFIVFPATLAVIYFTVF